MGIETGSLRDLHRLHQQFRELRSRIERGPKQLEARRQYLTNKEKELEEAREAFKRLRIAADQKDLELKQIEQKTQEVQRRLNEAKTNREYQALRDQIDADKMARRLHVFDHLLAGLIDCHTGIFAGAGVERAVGIENADHLQVVPLGAGIVVRIVGGGNFDGTGAHFHSGQQGVGNDRDFAID